MVGEGDDAPDFELPALVDGDRTTVALGDYRGDIVILAFYPGDFNPACDDESTDLDELDLFTMQKDVTILGISTDSVFSHVAFAERYDLAVPLLSDTTGDVLAQYDMAFTDDVGQRLAKRGVVVLDHNGVVQYRWETADLYELPQVERIRAAIEDIGGDDTALARYRVGHAHYVEGRRAFTSAMNAYEGSEWMMAQGDFTQAYEEFQEAAEHFDTAERFADDEEATTYYDRATEKATSLWQAAEWLADSANAFASGKGADGDQYRRDAEAPLEEAREIHEPVAPDDFPPEEDPAEQDDEQVSILPTDDGDDTDASLAVDLDEAATEPSGEAADAAEAMADTGAALDGDEHEDPPAAAGASAAGEDADDIDDAELEEITAELEQQTEQAQARHEAEQAAAADADEDAVGGDDPFDDAAEPEADDEHEADAADIEGDLDEDDLELDLADPTEGTDAEPDDAADLDDEDEADDPDDDLGDGSSPVPDSL